MKKIAIVAMAFLASALGANTLDGQAASETLSRAQNPAKVINPKATPKADPKVEAPKANPKDAIAIGVIEKVSVVGHKSFISAEDVMELLAKPLCDGKEKTIGDLKRVMAEAKQTLANRGYYIVDIMPSKAYAYDEATKTLELAVEPARFGDIKVSMKNNDGKGDWYNLEQVQKRFKYIKPGEPFNYVKFRQALRTLNGHPDLMADTKLRFVQGETGDESEYEPPRPQEYISGSLMGELGAEALAKPEDDEPEVKEGRPVRKLEAEVVVDDSAPLHATVEINNYAMKELKEWQLVATVQDINVTGADDVLSISPGVSFDGQMWSIAASYMRPFDWLRGGSWSVYGGYSDMDCDEIVQRMDLEGVGGFAGLNTSWNLFDDENRNLAFTLGIMWRYIYDQWSAQSVKLSPREIRLVPLTVGFTYGDKRRDWLGGLDFLSISESVNLYGDKALFYRYSENADPNYLVLRAAWSRLQPLLGPKEDGEEWRCWSAFQKLEAQCSHNNTLISPERLAYGGHNCLRGYRNRGYLGDTGVYGTTELRTPVWCNPVTGLFSSDLQFVLERFQFAIFTDYGWLSIDDTTTAKQDKDEFLWSAGFGVRAALTRYMSLNFDFALPLRKCYADDNDNHYEVYISVKFQY